MSNYLAVATATEALRGFLARSVRSVQPDLPQVDVSASKPPADPPDEPTVVIFLYQVTPNAALRNRDEPTRTPDGTLLNRPRAALDLHYLISFYGDEARLEPQRLLGAVVNSLNAYPVLQRADIEEALQRQYLEGSDLAAAPQQVRFTPIQMDVDDMNKLWSMLHQTPYALSVSYQASAVVLEGTETPAATRPVRSRTITTVPAAPPVVERVLSRPFGGGPATEDPLTRDRELVLEGTGLGGDRVTVRVGETDARVVDAGPGRLAVKLATDLLAGRYPVRVLRDVPIDGDDEQAPPEVRAGTESNTVRAARHPRLSARASGEAVTLTFDMPVGDYQRVTLLLDEGAPRGDREPNSYRFTAPFPLTGRGEQANVRVPAPGVEPGKYLVRAEVDGVHSVPNKQGNWPTVRVRD